MTLHTRDGGTFTTTRAEQGMFILVFDCASGKTLQVQPGLRIVRVHESTPRWSPPPETRPYSFFFTSLGRSPKPLPANVSFADLGTREIEGIVAHGYRTTQREASAEDDLKGRAGIFELWLSDDLAVTLLDVKSDLEGKSVSRTSLIHIKREEPDPSLFQIPPDYQVNPDVKDMPFVMNGGKVKR